LNARVHLKLFRHHNFVFPNVEALSALAEVFLRDEDGDGVFIPNFLIDIEQCRRLEKRGHMGVKMHEFHSGAPRQFYLRPDLPFYLTRFCGGRSQVFG